MNKVLNKDNISLIINKIRDENKTIGLTNGCFDILHIGHARYLKEARNNVDYLIVGINSDKSVKSLKGESRPINNENDRAELISYFSFVDFVIIFEEKTADNLLELIKPNFYIKGGDYTKENLPESKTLDKIGSEAIFINFVNGYSTTNLINKSKST